MHHMRRTIPMAVFLLAASCLARPAYAQTATCPTSSITPLSAAERAACEAELAQVQAEEQQAQAQLASAQSQSASIQKDIDVLAAQIKAEQLDIQAKNLQIRTLGSNITDKQNQIGSLEQQIANNQNDIADMFRNLEKADSYSLPEIVLSNETISGFFDDVSTLESLQQQIRDLSAELANEEASTTAAKNDLVTQQNAAIDARYAIQQEQKKVQANQAAEQQLLAVSKQNESAYQSLLADKKAQADAINARLFALAGGSNPIPFGQAYQYAVEAEKVTGVDPAFLLAIMTQETNLGGNQGTCYLTDSETGAGVNAKTGKTYPNVMSPTRDVPPYLTITGDLHADPYHTAVSCPQSIGWGGAMGPAQFIASTWMGLVDRVKQALNLSDMPNPWNPEHAFMASSIFLSDLGAGMQTYTAESNAACRYYSGSPCSRSSLVASYGRSVMALAEKIQETEIDKLQY